MSMTVPGRALGVGAARGTFFREGRGRPGFIAGRCRRVAEAEAGRAEATGAEEREKGREEPEAEAEREEAEAEAEAEAGRGIALRLWPPPRSSRFGTRGVLAVAASVARRSCRLEGAEEIWWASITALRGRALEPERELERERVAIVVSPRSQHTALYPMRPPGV